MPLDEGLPTFFIKPATDNPLSSTLFFGQGGHDLRPEYTLRRPDPNLPASKNCYAIALYDSYNPEVLFAEVLVNPEWTQPTLSQAEIRAQNGAAPSPVPIVPNHFTIQLYNPDQQVLVRQVSGSALWNSSPTYEFEMPQQTFRQPSASSLDRSQNDPAADIATPKITFKWKRDGKLSKDMTCVLAGKSTEGKKSREPDIPVAMFRHSKEVTIYEPNMHRVDVEDNKGLEVVLLLSAAVIKDIYFSASRDTFNLSGSVPSSSSLPLNPHSRPSTSSPPGGPSDPRKQAEIAAETERIKAMLEAEARDRARAEFEEESRIKAMLAAEEREQARRRDEEVARETERLRRQYGVQALPDFEHDPPSMSGATYVPSSPVPPGLPARPASWYPPPPPPPSAPPGKQGRTYSYGNNAGSVARPNSVPPPNNMSATSGPVYESPALVGNYGWSGPSAFPVSSAPPPQKQSHSFFGSSSSKPPRKHASSTGGPYMSGGAGTSSWGGGGGGGSAVGGGGSGSGGGAKSSTNLSTSVSHLLGIGINGEGGRKKVQKKRSVYF